MSRVAVLLITHEGVGAALRHVAQRLFGRLPLPVELLEVPFEQDLDALASVARQRLKQLDQGAGVLILCDLYGATPERLAGQLCAGPDGRVRKICGLNLPMLLRVLNYADRPLDELAEIAAGGAHGGIVVDQP